MPQQTQVNSATLVIGATGSGKSSLARTLADYLWETYRKVLYYSTCDGGGFPAKVQEGIAVGIIKVFRMRTRDLANGGLAFETCARVAQGWWPRRINPATGEVEPGVEMVPPIAKRWEMRCPNGHLVKTVVSESLLSPQACPQCRLMVTAQNMQITPVLQQSKGFEDRGGVFLDGLTSMLSWEMMELGQRAGRMELKGEEGAIGGKVVSGDMKWGGITRSHVGFAQTRGEELCHLALGIPNLLVPPVFTALTMETTDDAALSIVGPKIAGRAKTDEAGQWVGNCIEAAKVPAESGSGEQFALFLSEFTDAQGRRHLLKHRGAPGTMPDVLRDPPNGEAPFSKFNLGLFFRLLNDALTAGISEAQSQYPDAPGLPEGIAEYGDGGKAQPVAQPVAQPQAAAPVAASGPATLKQPAPAAAAPAAPAAPATPATATTAAPAAPAKPAAPRKAAAPKAQAANKPAEAAAPAVATLPAGEAPPVTPAAEQVAGPPTPVPQAPAAAAPPPSVAAPAAPAAPAIPSRPVGVAPPAGARPASALPRPPAAAPRPPAARPTAPPAVRPAPKA